MYVRLLLIADALEFFDKSQLASSLNSYDGIFELVVDPLFLSDDMNNEKLAEVIQVKNAVDLKLFSYNIGNDENFKHISNLGSDDREQDFSRISSKIDSMKSIINTSLISFVDRQIDKFKSLLQIINHHKSKRSEDWEYQISKSKEQFNKELKQVESNLIPFQSDFSKLTNAESVLKNLKEEIAALEKKCEGKPI